MQPRFERRVGNAPYTLVEQPRFRAGFDFLRLRADAGEIDPALAEWWEDFSLGDDEERRALMDDAREQEHARRTTSGAAPASGELAKKRRRRRRKPASAAAGPDAPAGLPEGDPTR